ncbi:MAG: hypothetical protein WAZ12_03875 [Candidatus Absconditicoccaceae bacterium]
MKKVLYILGFSIFCLSIPHTLAYIPTSGDIQQINSLKNSLNTIISGNNQDLWNFYYQLKNLQSKFGSNSRLDYMLNDLKQHLYTQFYTKKNQAKQESKEIKQNFVNEYISGVMINSPIPGNCTGRYNTLDDISFAYNIPTAWTVATRYRESTCGYYLPGNGDGPFQILSKDYGTGEITEDIFIQSAQDFMTFTKAKQIQYKTKLGIKMTYTGFDRTGLINQGSLYNGGFISGNIVIPNAPKYIYDGYGIEYSGAVKYGLIPKFIKFLDRELKNKY